MLTMLAPTMTTSPLSPTIDNMLSQLAFCAEMPTDQAYQDADSLWNGLFCFSFDYEDEDLFFDALEDPLPEDEDDEEKLSAPSSSPVNNATTTSTTNHDSPFVQMRGGASGSTSTRSNIIGSESSLAVSNLHEVRSAQPSSQSAPPNNNSDQKAPLSRLKPYDLIVTSLKNSMSHHLYHSSSEGAAHSAQEELNDEQAQKVSPAHPPLPSSLPTYHQSPVAIHLGHEEDSSNPFSGRSPPPPPDELPLRFLRAGKGDPVEGQRRYETTLQWRKEHSIDTILMELHPHFELIKSHYPHYYHLRGHNGEPVFFEQPPKTNLQAMREGGVTLPGLLRHYAMVTEFQWQWIERDDHARSIYVLDLEGMRMMDFVGECVEYVRKCSEFTGQHYPERAGYVLVVNVPGWFAMIWNVVKPMVDEVTLRKITILRGDKEQILKALLEKIPITNIPPEYGGLSMPLGESPEEKALRDLMRHNLARADGDISCGGRVANPPCPFCSFVPARSY